MSDPDDVLAQIDDALDGWCTARDDTVSPDAMRAWPADTEPSVPYARKVVTWAGLGDGKPPLPQLAPVNWDGWTSVGIIVDEDPIDREDLNAQRLRAMESFQRSTDWEALNEQLRNAAGRIGAAVGAQVEHIQAIGSVLHRLCESLVDVGVIEEPLPVDVRARALELRRKRGTGPPPPRLDGRRR